MMSQRAKFYLPVDQIDPESDLQQGDIIDKVPFAAFQMSAALIALNKQIREVDLTDERAEDLDDARLVAAFALAPAIVISQSCDLARGKRPITLAQIRAFRDVYKDQEIGSKGFRSRLKDLANPGKSPILFPMPPSGGPLLGNQYSLVDMLLITTLATQNYDALQKLRLGRLAPEAALLLQERASRCFGRLAATDGLFFGDSDFKAEYPDR